MNDNELKQVLLETWPIRPGQEERAWSSLQDSRRGKASRSAGLFTWPRLAFSGFALAGVTFLVLQLQPPTAPSVSAASQSPGIFATAFYSQPARAQVVWLNGMDPATDGPTYMDPTTKVDETTPAAMPAGGKSDSL